MSKSWSGGSTRAWRTLRALVLRRDGYRCRLQLPGCTTTATQVHHTHGRAVTGDDPQYLTSACRSCNLKTGDPNRHDPAPKPRTRW